MRLIDADTLNYVRVRIYHDDGTIGGYNAVVPSSEIKNAPTVEAEPVRHGAWRHYERMLTCSECGTVFYDDIMEYFGDEVPRYCPECGAKMDAERKEE